MTSTDEIATSSTGPVVLIDAVWLSKFAKGELYDGDDSKDGESVGSEKKPSLPVIRGGRTLSASIRRPSTLDRCTRT